MRRGAAIVAAVTFAASLTACSSAPEPIRIGALYPLSGTQGPGGIEEHRGVELAADLVNADGGVDGRPIELVSLDVPQADAAPAAVDLLADDGISLVVGSYGSTISSVIARATAAEGMVFWETGAVGMLPGDVRRGELTFRMPPTGGVLGRNAIAFVADRLADELGRDPRELRYGVAFVDDVYGRSVAAGALAEIDERALPLVGRFGYDPHDVDMRDVARRIDRAGVDVLFVSAYLQDGIAMREALIAEHVPLVASIGTSSSYCMPQFGEALGTDAVGLFASDKPDADAIATAGLAPGAAALLDRAKAEYRDRWGDEMRSPALAGFAAAWALFREVLPNADATTGASPSPPSVAAAARSVNLPLGALPNGSGLRFGAPGTRDAGDNLRAAGVIWEWIRPGEHVVVWPPAFATHPVEALPIR
ncbi:MAG TPA: ABC transporter substrate-binding protein [Actinomycetota bacterium]|nr:ABC transporter substrate-binding protein [Actinomycetota bacterium]